ncbi:hypothetical protein ACNJUT_22445, partial [Mycobacterium tuberculosis]
KGFARYTAYGLGAALIGFSALAPRPAVAFQPIALQSITTTSDTRGYDTNSCGYSAAAFTNNAGAAVTFTVIADDGANLHSTINNAQTTCAVGARGAPT